MARLVFAGEAIVDIVMRVPRLPERGGDMLATHSAVTAGGGFNVMAAAARQGMPVSYAGGHGTGPWGDLVRAALAAEGIAVFREPDPQRDTGFDVALVEPDAERTFVTHLGAEALRDAREPGTRPRWSRRLRLHLRLWPGPRAVRPGPGELGRCPPRRRHALPGPRPAGRRDPGARCSGRSWPASTGSAATRGRRGLLSGTEDPVRAARRLRGRDSPRQHPRP